MKNKEEKPKKANIVMTGVVKSAKADKTVSVSVERIFQHPVYKKIVRKRKKFLAHDEQNKCKAGDIVKIKLVKPISKGKKWLVVDIISAGPEEEVAI
jgi:small subunit ribosomal protein S17